MQSKLTLRLDDAVIRRAKAIAERRGKSVSQMVGDYFQLLDDETELGAEELTPAVRSLLGSLSGSKVDEKDYRDWLEQKYR